MKAYVRNDVNYLTTVDHATTVHGRGLPWALAAGHWQFTVYRLRHSLTNQPDVQLPGRLPDQFPKV